MENPETYPIRWLHVAGFVQLCYCVGSKRKPSNPLGLEKSALVSDAFSLPAYEMGIIQLFDNRTITITLNPDPQDCKRKVADI